jgi:hypothetical protein
VPAPEEVFIRIAPELVAGRILDETGGGETRGARNEERASASADVS